MRNSVSLLTSMLSRREREATDPPPSAMPDRGPHRRGGSSVELLARPSRTVRQRSAARKPQRPRRSGASAKSALFARLRPEDSQSPSILAVHAATNAPHIGHRQTLAESFIPITKPPSSPVARSTTNPRGNKFRNLNPCIALIPSPNQSQTGASTSSKVSQGPYSPQIRGPVSVIIDRSKSPGSVQRFLSVHAAVATRSTSSVISLPAASFASYKR
jgi:hypothetical protein